MKNLSNIKGWIVTWERTPLGSSILIDIQDGLVFCADLLEDGQIDRFVIFSQERVSSVSCIQPNDNFLSKWVSMTIKQAAQEIIEQSKWVAIATSDLTLQYGTLATFTHEYLSIHAVTPAGSNHGLGIYRWSDIEYMQFGGDEFELLGNGITSFEQRNSNSMPGSFVEVLSTSVHHFVEIILRGAAGIKGWIVGLDSSWILIALTDEYGNFECFEFLPVSKIESFRFLPTFAGTVNTEWYQMKVSSTLERLIETKRVIRIFIESVGLTEGVLLGINQGVVSWELMDPMGTLSDTTTYTCEDKVLKIEFGGLSRIPFGYRSRPC